MKAPAALVIGIGKHGADDEDEETKDDASDEGAEADAGQALVDAINAKDGQAVYDAFATLHALCNGEH